MSGGWLSYLTGSGAKGGRDSTREAIVNLREHLLMLDKKEEHLNTKIENEQRKAKANATTNKRGQSQQSLPLGRGCVTSGLAAMIRRVGLAESAAADEGERGGRRRARAGSGVSWPTA